MKKKLVDWLKTQPKEFTAEVLGDEYEMLGDGHFSVADLIELDLKYNSPEDE